LEPIAIIGAACRFPGATGIDAFWQLLRNSRSAVRTVPKERWDVDKYYDPDPNAPGKMTSPFGGFVEGISKFDYAFFGISRREAAKMDPQQRLLCEVAWEALEDAQLPMDTLAGSQTAVFVGIGPGDYSRLCLDPPEAIDAYVSTGNFLSIAANRISYFFDLRGPSIAIDTACSSSLVAVHLACRSIESGEATLALAGGVNALLSPAISISFSKARMLSPTGRCSAFGAGADGYVRSEGAGLVVLKPLARAQADKDRIYAVVRASAVNQSGQRNGLTAPGGWGEEAVMRAAWASTTFPLGEVDYVEAQGTGTLLGDAIEAAALGKVFGHRAKASALCRIGSVKTNLGHLETAAGIASLIKVILMIWHGEFVPMLHHQVPNPHVDLEKLGLTIQRRVEPWLTVNNSPRVAGVSAFGFGGTNAHLCLTSSETGSECCSCQEAQATAGFLLPVSARHCGALGHLVRQMHDLIENANAADALEICRAAARRRTHHDYRVAFAGLTPPAVARAMLSWLEHAKPEAARVGGGRKLVIVASGSGARKHSEVLAAVRAFGAERTENGQRALANHELIAMFAVLRILSHWGIRPYRVFGLVGGDLLVNLTVERTSGKQTVESAAAGNSNQRSQTELEEALSIADDFLDLTGENFVPRFYPLPVGGHLLGGFSSTEHPRLTLLRLAAELYQLGYPLTWQNIYPGTVKHIGLPLYPWQHQPC
jgi:acyl transferase domain-containing protein